MKASFTLPSLTLPDPMVSGEGALDPLGLANLADRLAEELVQPSDVDVVTALLPA